MRNAATVQLTVIPQETSFTVRIERQTLGEKLGFTICDGFVASIKPGSLADRANLQLGHKIIRSVVSIVSVCRQTMLIRSPSVGLQRQ